MKILVVAESINVEDSSGSKVNVALIQNLHLAGFEVKVLHYSHKKIELENIHCVLVKESKFSFLYFLSRFVRIFQRKTKILINETLETIFGFSFTYINDVRSIIKSVKNEVDFNPDFILTLSKGGSFRPHNALLKLPQLQDKWIAYIHDPYPFHFYPRPYNWVQKSYYHKEKFMLSISEKAKYLAFPSLLLKEWMQSYFPAVKDKSIIIPHQITYSNESDYLPDFFNQHQFSLVHAGNLLKQRNPQFLLEAFSNFLENNPIAKEHAALYFIGHNEHHKETVKPYFQNPNFVFKDYMDYNTIQTIEKKASVNIILEAVAEISPFLPGKFPNCVKADRPILILGPYYSEVKRLLGNEYPFWAESNDLDKIQNVIQKLYDSWIESPNKLALNREDLLRYCSEIHLKSTIENLK
jgi:hypothetical protein